VSYERIVKALIDLGLKRSDAEVYVFLAAKGSHSVKDLAKAMDSYEQQLYRILKRLRDRGIVKVTHSRCTLYSALPFDVALDLFTKGKMVEASDIEQNKKQILSYWHQTR
jgi:sugar-specific transcriptional regulator TrmB